MHSYFENLYETECASQHYHRTLENIGIWYIAVVSEHVPNQLWACKSVNEFRRAIQHYLLEKEELEDIELGDREYQFGKGKETMAADDK